MTDGFNYAGERFADQQILRYRLNGFDRLTLDQKLYVYYLAKATLAGRDITFDQNGKHNLRIRKMLEAVFSYYEGKERGEAFEHLVTYLKRVWFSNGIYHHYGCEKFIPQCSPEYLKGLLEGMPETLLPLENGDTPDELVRQLFPVIFDPQVMPKRVNKADGQDLVVTSACNFYEGVTQREVEEYYQAMKDPDDTQPPSWGLNTLLKKVDGQLAEVVWKADGMYGQAITEIVGWLRKAADVAENNEQRKTIQMLIDFYTTGDLRLFDQFSIQWVKTLQGDIDFINGFIEVYGDPLGLKATWEGIVEYKDHDATVRTRKVSDNAQWFEDHSPVDPRFRKPVVKGVVANVVCAAMLGGEEYPSTAIGINLPNADWIRAEHGSKSVTIGNLTDAYNKAAHGNGFKEEFVVDDDTLDIIERYGDLCDDLHTDLHECLGHGSGQLLPGTSPDALKAYGNTIEEARADLFGLYFMADPKMVQLGLLPDGEAYKAQYYSYMMNGLLTQLTRIMPGNRIEEAHMRNRALIARWTLSHAEGAVCLTNKEGKTYVVINDYQRLRSLFGQLLAEVQRIKSEGDYEAARALVEDYAVDVEPTLHSEILERYRQLDLAPYKGFLNPKLSLVYDEKGNVSDVVADYSESYTQQMMRYSSEYSFL